MKSGAPPSFATRLKALREAAGFTQEELATIAGLSVHAVSALERGQRRRPHPETVRALSAALDLTGTARDTFLASPRAPSPDAAIDESNRDALPIAPTPLLGREADVRTLRAWFADTAARLVTLTGPGGVGKSRLALEVARAIADEDCVRVLFVSLASIREPRLVASAIVEAFGFADVSASDLPQRARLACENQPTLLVLDTFEQVLDAAPLVAHLLTAARPLRMLVTSRAPLRVRGEREYPVVPLELESGSDALSPADLARMPAVRLFLERVRDVHPHFRLTSATGPTVTAICQRLDRLPLALELAARWTKVLTVEDLLRRLEHDVLLSPIEARDAPERQQTISATVAWSYQLLGPSEQRAFRRLGALPGPFSIEAAAVLAADDGVAADSDGALGVVARLIDKSLLLRAESAFATRPMYVMLATVRAYAVRELTMAGEHDAALAALAGYCLSECGRAAEGLVGPAHAEWLDHVHDDLETYRWALTWLLARGRAVDAADIAFGLMRFWLIRGHATEGLHWYEQILNAPPLPPAAMARALIGAALMTSTQGASGSARAMLDQGLALARAANHMDLAALAETLFGRIAGDDGDVNAVPAPSIHAVEAFQAMAISWRGGTTLTESADRALATGDRRGRLARSGLIAPLSRQRLVSDAGTVFPPADLLPELNIDRAQV